MPCIAVRPMTAPAIWPCVPVGPVFWIVSYSFSEAWCRNHDGCGQSMSGATAPTPTWCDRVHGTGAGADMTIPPKIAVANGDHDNQQRR